MQARRLAVAALVVGVAIGQLRDVMQLAPPFEQLSPDRVVDGTASDVEV